MYISELFFQNECIGSLLFFVVENISSLLFFGLTI